MVWDVKLANKSNYEKLLQLYAEDKIYEYKKSGLYPSVALDNLNKTLQKKETSWTESKFKYHWYKTNL